jgi:hypothetical protein
VNIFYLDADPKLAAQFHMDRHVIKMVLETAQMLSAAHRVLDGDHWLALSGEGPVPIMAPRWDNLPGKRCLAPTHLSHPCTVWARSCRANYEWLFELFEALYCEKVHRYGGGHVTFEAFHEFLSRPPKAIPDSPSTEPAQAMPEEYRIHGDPVEAYRRYYAGAKAHIAGWRVRGEPSWWAGYVKEPA